MITKEDELYFSKVRPEAIIPTKKEEDAGYDLYPCFYEDYIAIPPFSTRIIPTGIATAFNKKYYAQIEERSSLAKLGIKKSGGVIDSGYRGEYYICIYNTNPKPFIISKLAPENFQSKILIEGKKYKKENVIFYSHTQAICQIVLQPVPQLKSKELPYDQLLKIKSQRGTGNFGHSGK